VAKAVLISSVPPIMVQTDANPGGLPKSVFDGFQAQVAGHRSPCYRDLHTTQAETINADLLAFLRSRPASDPPGRVICRNAGS
jgi:non-heme chloroperoxidase